MDIQWSIFGAVLILNASIAALIAGILIWKYEAAGRQSMSFMLISLAVWSFAYAMIIFSPDLAAKRFWLRIENLGILSQPALWFIFTRRYSKRDKLPTRSYIAALGFIPIVSIIMIFSDDWFHYYYSSVKPFTENIGPLVIQRGPWYWVALAQSYFLNAMATILLIWRFIEFRNIFRRQLGLLITASLIPLILNILYQLLTNLVPSFFFPVDVTPISFTISAGLISAGIFRAHLLDLVPIGRDVVMEHIPELVFVVDAHNRVLDANSVAEKWLGRSKDEMIGRDPMETFRQWPQFLNRYLSTEGAREEVPVPGGGSRMLEIVVTPLFDNISGQLKGRVVVAHDITERKQLEIELKEANETLRAKIVEVESLRAQLQELAIRDALTNVFNRRFLAEALEKEIAQAEREHTPVSVVMMDVDHFKEFNDRYGHKCGDLVLKDLAVFLMANSRQGDVVCRYGGEEFVILMPNASHDNAYERAEVWRRDYAKKPFHFDNRILHTSFSAGVASYPLHGPAGEAILHAADKALYHSKSHGRNKVTLYQNQSNGRQI